MLYLTVINDPNKKLFHQVYENLNKLYNVMKVENNKICAPEKDVEIILCAMEDLVDFQVPSPIIIVGNEQQPSTPLPIPYEATVIVDINSVNFIHCSADKNIHIVDCGLSPKSTLTFSSVGRENLVLSLQRTIYNIRGVAIDPFDIPLDLCYGTQYPALVVGAIFILGDLINKNTTGYL